MSSTFFKFFQIFSLLAVVLLSCNFYIISHRLPFVKLFLNLFSKFFPSAFRLCSFKRLPFAQFFLTYFVSRLSSRPTALLLYHLFCTLSTKRLSVFLEFFCYILPYYYQSVSMPYKNSHRIEKTTAVPARTAAIIMFFFISSSYSNFDGLLLLNRISFFVPTANA